VKTGEGPTHFVGPFTYTMDLGERKTPPAFPPSVEVLSDARTLLADFFSI